MGKINLFLDTERKEYEGIYSDLIMRIDEISDFIDEKEIRKRHYSKKVQLIKDYLDQLSDIEYKSSEKGFFKIFSKDEQYKSEALRYKSTIQTDLNKLKLCHSCKCSSCLQECPFNICHMCKHTNYTINCNLKDQYIFGGEANVMLYSNDENRDVSFRVVGLLFDLSASKHYIYLVELQNPNNQHILQYQKKVNGEIEYLSLEKEELDLVYNKFVELDCYE